MTMGGRQQALGERIRAARRMAGLNQRALAEKVGVSAMAISKYENGKMAPGSDVLLRLADALNVPVEFFLRPDPVALEAVNFRRHNKVSAAVLERAKARAAGWVERLKEAEALAGAELEARFELLEKWAVSALADVEERAAALRAEWGLGEAAIRSFVDLLELHGVRVGETELPDEVDALVFETEAREPVILLREGLPGDRQRFTLGHDLCHLVLRCPDKLDEEAVCHRFAAAFLVPAATARRELGKTRDDLSLLELHNLKHKYGMSMMAWVKRAGELGIVSDGYVKKIEREFKRRGWEKVEPGDQVEAEHPRRLQQLVIRLVEEEVIGIRRAGELLGQPWDDFVNQRSEDSGGLPVAIDL